MNPGLVAATAAASGDERPVSSKGLALTVAAIFTLLFGFVVVFSACSAPLKNCVVEFDKPAPDATLKCEDADPIPMTNVAPWLRKCAKDKGAYVPRPHEDP